MSNEGGLIWNRHGGSTKKTAPVRARGYAVGGEFRPSAFFASQPKYRHVRFCRYLFLPVTVRG